jgi:photosystem II stability/assembly factor-like uncharacterized protein
MTFISATKGWLLTERGSSYANHLVVDHTTDGGKTWHEVGVAPFLSWTICLNGCNNFQTASQIRFVDPTHGYIFGPDFAMTNDGGRTWINLRKQVYSLEAAGSSVVAVQKSTPFNSSIANDSRLIYATVGSTNFTDAQTLPLSSTTSLTRQGHTVWAVAHSAHRTGSLVTWMARVLTSTNDGHTWAERSQPTAVGAKLDLDGIASAGPRTLWVGARSAVNGRCYEAASADGGSHWSVFPDPFCKTSDFADPPAPIPASNCFSAPMARHG